MKAITGISAALLATGLMVGAVGEANAQDILVTPTVWSTTGVANSSSPTLTSTLTINNPNPFPISVGDSFSLGTESVKPEQSTATGTFSGQTVTTDFDYYNGTFGNQLMATGTLSGKGVITWDSLQEFGTPGGPGVTTAGGPAQSTTNASLVTDPGTGELALALTLTEGGQSAIFYLDDVDTPTYKTGGSGAGQINTSADVNGFLGPATPVPEFGSCAGLVTMLTGGGLLRLTTRRRNRK